MRAAAIVAIALLISACLGTGGSSTEVTAKKHSSTANTASMEWGNDSKLVAVAAFEITNTTVMPGETDTAPGDGNARSWIYYYSSDAKKDKLFAIIIAANGTVLSKTEVPVGTDAAVVGSPIGEWKLDSNEAATKARSNASFRTAVSDLDGFVVMNLAQPPGEGVHAIWILLAQSTKQGGGEAVVVVDAVNGTVLDPEIFERLFKTVEPVQERGTFTGQLNSANAMSLTHTFKVQNPGHPLAKVRLSVSFAGVPTTRINISVKDPAGMSFARELTLAAPSGPMGGGQSVIVGIPNSPALVGDYVITATLRAGAAQNYNVYWCAHGSPLPSMGGGGGGGGGAANYPCT